MIKKSVIAIIALASAMLVGCGHSESQASETQAGVNSSADSGAFPLPKEFAHRYNALATENLKIVEIKDIGGVEGEDWTELYFADKNLENIAGQVQQQSFNYDPRHASKDIIKTVCTWMVRAANPNVSNADAMAMATSVVDHHAKMIVSNVVLKSYDDHGCVVSYTGL